MRRSTLLVLCGLALAFALPIAFALRSLVWLEWRVALPQPAVAGPLLAGGRVLVAGADGTLLAFGAEDGRERWRASCGAPLGAESVAAGDGLALCAGGGRLLALDLTTGAARFDERLPDGAEAAVALAGSRLLVAQLDTLLGVSLEAGAPRFQATPWPGRRLTSLRVAGGLVLATSALRAEGAAPAGGGVAGLDAATGALRWLRELDAPVEAAAEPAGDLFLALASSDPPQVFALEIRSGAPRWSGPGETVPVALGGQAIDAAGATLRARDLASGAPRWEKFGFEAPWSAPPARAGELVLAPFGASLFGFHAGGAQGFAYSLRGRIGPRLAGDASRVFYVEDGAALVALDVDRALWPMLARTVGDPS